MDSNKFRRSSKPKLYCITTNLVETEGALPLADYLLELKLCLEVDEEFFLLTSNPDFDQGRIEKNQLVRKAGVICG